MASSLMPPTNPEPVSNQGPSASDPTTAAAAVSSNTPSGTISSSSKISTLADLRAISLKLYREFMLGAAQFICQKMQNDQNRLKEMMRKDRQDNG